MRLGWKPGLWLVCVGPAVLNAFLYYSESNALIPVLFATMLLVGLVMFRAVGSLRRFGLVLSGGVVGCVIGVLLGCLIETIILAGYRDLPKEIVVSTAALDWYSEIIGSAMIVYLSSGFFLGCWFVTLLFKSPGLTAADRKTLNL